MAFRLHFVSIFALVLSAGAADGIVFRQSFPPAAVPDGAAPGDGDGVAGSYCRYETAVRPPRHRLEAPLAGDYTLGVWLRAKEWLEEAPSGFGKRVPPTLMALYDTDDSAPLVFRVCLRRLQVAANREGKWAHADGWRELPAGEWVHAALVRRGGDVVLYLNGVRETGLALHRPDKPLAAVQVGSIAERTFYGDLDEATVWNRALTEGELAALVPADKRARVAGFARPARDLPGPAYPGRELRVAAGDSAPLVAGLSAHILALPWFGAGRNDLLSWGQIFGAHPAIHRELERGRYAPDQPARELAAGGDLPAPPYYRLDRPDGNFDLVSTGRGTALEGQLVLHRNTGKDGAPVFADAQPIPCADREFRSAYGAALTAVQDVDGDGQADLLLVRGHMGASYLPDAPASFWGGEELPSTGKGKGYSVNGQWLGHDSRHLLLWARGGRDEQGAPVFGKALPVYRGEADFPVQWKGVGTPRAAWLACGGTTWLVMAGSVDRILAMPARVDGDAIRCGAPVPLLAEAAPLRYVYYPHAIDVRDLDGDGAPELLVSGNPGSLSILRGDRIGAFREERAMQVGGALAMQTLIVPCRIDWDGDGVPDLLAGDASGWLEYWPGTTDPMVYRASVPLCVEGRPVHIQAGYDGSIQGPNECRWGYLNPTVGDWDGDGRADLVTCDIRADMLLFPRGDAPGRLLPPVPFTRAGAKLPVAWRQRPAILPGRHGLAGDRPCLLHLDWDGILAIGVPASTGATDIVEQRQLHYEDGQPVKLDGPAGLWGRAKFAVADWDGDGTWDVLFGTNRSDQRFFSEECARREAMPFLLRNTGSNAHPVFARPVPIRLGDEYLGFGVHIAAVWPTDLDGDGREDLLIGAEDGRIYRFLRQELCP